MNRAPGRFGVLDWQLPEHFVPRHNDLLTKLCHVAGLSEVEQMGVPRFNRAPLDLD